MRIIMLFLPMNQSNNFYYYFNYTNEESCRYFYYSFKFTGYLSVNDSGASVTGKTCVICSDFICDCDT